MIRVRENRTVSIEGRENVLFDILTSPLSCCNESCYYYKSTLYRIVNEKPSCRIIVASAYDVLCCFDSLLDYRPLDNKVIYLIDYYKAKKQGIVIDENKLAYVLNCPVVVETKHSCRGLNRLLEAVSVVAEMHMSADSLCVHKSMCRKVAYVRKPRHRGLYINKITKYVLKIFANLLKYNY